MSTPTLDQLKRALQISEQIEGLKAELDAIFDGNGKVPASIKGPAAKAKAVKSGKRTMSPEARAKISAAAKKRWAGVKAKATTTASQIKPAAKVPGANKKTKRNISPESRAKMAAAAKKRWAGVKKAAK